MTHSPTDLQIRQLTAEDAQAFSDLRREVTADDPVPMGLTYQEELTRTLAGFQAQLSQPTPSAVFGAFVDGELAATAAISRVSPFASSAHKMVMWGVFTSPRYRRRGLGRQLVTTALQHAAAAGVRRVNLQVYLPNEAALQLYRSLGFAQTGVEPEAVCLESCYFDGVHMSASLEPALLHERAAGSFARQP